MIHQPKYRTQFRELSRRNFQLKFLMWKQTKFRQCSRVSLLFDHSHWCLAGPLSDWLRCEDSGRLVCASSIIVLLILDSQPSEELSGVVSEWPAVIDYSSNPIYFSPLFKIIHLHFRVPACLMDFVYPLRRIYKGSCTCVAIRGARTQQDDFLSPTVNLSLSWPCQKRLL